MTPLKIIEQLDELGKEAVLSWEPSHSIIWDETSSAEQVFYTKLFEVYPQLRKAVLAGSKLAKAVSPNVITMKDGINIGQYKHLSDGTIVESENWHRMNEALSAYHAEVNDL